MKKLVTLVMILAIATPALAEDLNPPEWAGAPGSMKAYWTYDEDAPGDPDWPRLDAPDEPMEVTPHSEREGPEDLQLLYEEEFEGEYPGLDFTGVYALQNGAGDPQVTETPAVWESTFQGHSGVLTGITMMGYEINNFEYNSEGHKDVLIQITWYLETGSVEDEGFDIWLLLEGFGEGEALTGGFADYADSIDTEIDLGGGWRHSSFYLSTYDPCGPTDFNPSSEYIEIGTEEGNWVIAIDEVVIHTICYDGDEPPLGLGGDGTIVVDPNITTIYEPQDAGGPQVTGPVVGNFGVKLGWMPAEPNIVYVTVDPNDEGDGPNEDYKIQGADPCDGTVTLAFNQGNWDVLQKVRIEAIEDLDKEGTENLVLNLTSYTDEINGDPCFIDGWLRMGITVKDNDIRSLSIIPDEVVVSENDPCTCAEFAVRLSHRPADNADVKVLVVGDGLAFEAGMAYIDPPLISEGLSDPNSLTFTDVDDEAFDPCTMTSGWNVEQTIKVCAIDNDETAEAWTEYIAGQIFLTPYSEDPGYRVPDLDAQGNEVEDSGGEADEETVDVSVQDNDCGALGYDLADFNEDCVVNLADFAEYFARWLFCTEPYDGAVYGEWSNCNALWNLIEEE
ncbi:MAG: hypothetical protein ACYSWP_12760 [Planctomycetota bacterium]